MSKKIYVGNISYNTNQSDLTEIFSEYGEVVSVNVIEDKFTGKSKGFAFVEMASEESAAAAIEDLTDAELDGRTLRVNEAISKPKNNYRNNNNDRY